MTSIGVQEHGAPRGYYEETAPPLPGSIASEFGEMDLGDLEDLAETLEENPEGDIEQLKSFITAHYHIFSRTERGEHLDTAIEHLQCLLNRTDVSDPGYGALLRDMIVMLTKKFRCTLNPDHLEAAIWRAKELLDLTGYLHPEIRPRWEGLLKLAALFRDHTGKSTLLGEVSARAWAATKNGAELLVLYYENPESVNVLGVEDCFTRVKEALAIPGHSEKFKRELLLFGAVLSHKKWERSRAAADLDETLTLIQIALPFCKGNTEPEVKMWLFQVMQILETIVRGSGKSERVKGIGSAHRAATVRCLEYAIAVTGPNLPEYRVAQFTILHDALVHRAEEDNRLGALDRAIRIIERLIEKDSLNSDERPRWQYTLARHLACKFARSTSATDFESMNKSIAYLREVAACTLTNPHAEGVEWLTAASDLLFLKYTHYGGQDIEDLRMSIQYLKRIIDISYDGDHHSRFKRQSELVYRLFILYGLQGSVETFAEIVNTAGDALERLEDNQIHSQAWDALKIVSSLSTSTAKRYLETGDKELFDEAIRHIERVASILADHGKHKNTVLFLLADTYFYRRTDAEDIQKAIQLITQALEITSPEEKVLRSSMFTKLAEFLFIRHELSSNNDPGDIDHAITLVQTADHMMPGALPLGIRSVNSRSLSRMFLCKSQESLGDSKECLDKAIFWARDAVRLAPQNSGPKPELAECLAQRWQSAGLLDDIEEAVGLYKAGMNDNTSSPSDRIHCAISAAFYLKKLGRLREFAGITEQAVHLLPLLSPRALKHSDQQRRIKGMSLITLTAVAAAFDTGGEATHCLELLELGRGIINSLKLDFRTDLNKLKKDHPELAKQFIDIRDDLERLMTPVAPLAESKLGLPLMNPEAAQLHNRKRKLTQDFDDIAKQIRDQPGYQAFMLPPRADDLRMASTSLGEAVVLLNLGERCDAIIIQNKKVRHLHLPEAPKEAVLEKLSEIIDICWPLTVPYNKRRGKLVEILEWLWKAVVGPVLNELGFTSPPSEDEDWPRVCWVPTGLLTQLPLHAAGLYSSADANQSAIDRVVSTYSSSVKASLHAIQNQQQRDPKEPNRKVVLTSMSNTPGAAPLTNAVKEIDEIERVLLPTGADVVKLHDPSKAELMVHLGSCAVFHFAGHGESDSEDPSQSRILLRDWKSDPLTVKDMLELNISDRRPWLAYLSACSTGNVRDFKLVDEAIHLMSACQTAGFQHVIGSLWEVSDYYSAELAKKMYQDLKDDLGKPTANVALALHKSIRQLRKDTGFSLARRSGDQGEEVGVYSIDEALGADSADSSGDDSNGNRGAKVRRVIRSSSAINYAGDPLIWAAYIHMGP